MLLTPNPRNTRTNLNLLYSSWSRNNEKNLFNAERVQDVHACGRRTGFWRLEFCQHNCSRVEVPAAEPVKESVYTLLSHHHIIQEPEGLPRHPSILVDVSPIRLIQRGFLP